MIGLTTTVFEQDRMVDIAYERYTDRLIDEMEKRDINGALLETSQDLDVVIKHLHNAADYLDHAEAECPSFRYSAQIGALYEAIDKVVSDIMSIKEGLEKE